MKEEKFGEGGRECVSEADQVVLGPVAANSILIKIFKIVRSLLHYLVVNGN